MPSPSPVATPLHQLQAGDVVRFLSPAQGDQLAGDEAPFLVLNEGYLLCLRGPAAPAPARMSWARGEGLRAVVTAHIDSLRADFLTLARRALDAEEKAMFGAEWVHIHDLRPGDLVVFRNPLRKDGAVCPTDYLVVPYGSGPDQLIGLLDAGDRFHDSIIPIGTFHHLEARVRGRIRTDPDLGVMHRRASEVLQMIKGSKACAEAAVNQDLAQGPKGPDMEPFVPVGANGPAGPSAGRLHSLTPAPMAKTELSPAERAALNAAVRRHLGPSVEGLVEAAVERALLGQVKRLVRIEGGRPDATELLGEGAPLGVLRQALAGEAEQTVQVYPEQGTFEIYGVRALNSPFEILVTRVVGPGQAHSLLPGGEVDAAVFEIPFKGDEDMLCPETLKKTRPEDGYYRQAWGTISRDRPLLITFRTMGCPMVLPFLSWVLFGKHVVEEGAPLLPTRQEQGNAAHEKWMAENDAAREEAELRKLRPLVGDEPHPKAEEWACTGCTRPYPYVQHPEAKEFDPNRCVDCPPAAEQA